MPQRQDSAGTECNAVMGMLFLGARAPLDLLNVKVKVKVKTAKEFWNTIQELDRSVIFRGLEKWLGIVPGVPTKMIHKI